MLIQYYKPGYYYSQTLSASKHIIKLGLFVLSLNTVKNVDTYMNEYSKL